MIFEAIYQSSQKGELILIHGGYCRFHLRRDGQLTILEILSLRPGAGREMLGLLKGRHPKSIFAKCPSDLPANHWYRRRGFLLEKEEELPSGRKVNHWRLKWT